MEPTSKPRPSKAWVVFPLVVGAAVAAGVLLWRPLTESFRDPQSARAWVGSLGAAAPLAYVGVQFLQVLVFIIPGEVVQIGGGFVFGFWGAVMLSSAGILAGSIVNYFVGRLAGRPFVERVLKP
ncbi:MAG TPA: VTT domain-containing protein, partial [Magnetospirillaceae bacterium]|nr:VTT domain-containing protein [Magnetospirillaceae bacterium]